MLFLAERLDRKGARSRRSCVRLSDRSKSDDGGHAADEHKTAKERRGWERGEIISMFLVFAALYMTYGNFYIVDEVGYSLRTFQAHSTRSDQQVLILNRMTLECCNGTL